MIGKIEDALPYKEQADGLPQDGGVTSMQCEDPNWCPKLKSAAYYKALKATGCWPVRKAMVYCSVYAVLATLARTFNYVNYDDLRGVPDRAAARARMPGTQGAPKDKRCRICVDAAVKSAMDGKVKSLINTLLDEKKTWISIERQGQTVQMEVDDSFAGLCLDCLTRTKFGSEDADYWNHCLDFEFDHGCRVRHGEPTWYFSYLGRPENMEQYLKTQNAQRQI